MPRGIKFILAAVYALLLLTPSAFAHRAGQDKQGCHHDRKQGDYHCHKGPLEGRTFKSKEEALEALADEQGAPPVRPQASKAITSTQAETASVVRVVDGDTIVLTDGRKVRLIGVDTPELHHPKKPVQYFAKEARDFVSDLVLGKTIGLAFDPANIYVKHTDKYGRLLAYIVLPDGDLLNVKLIREGYGHAYTRFPFRYLEEHRTLEREAREQKRGLWK
ncbi:MAG: thermonuclease family protein [Elusimicrobiota bacterium]